VFEYILLVLTKRLRIAFYFLSHFFLMLPRVFCAKSSRQNYCYYYQYMDLRGASCLARLER
ncbi:hypothetical protein, partial [Klebsiella pneumoniae]|uniref:hypothetical protein n=1 Tax=Klebsiella pneumoniae TaxID=573 RepID=UPI001A936AAB